MVFPVSRKFVHDLQNYQNHIITIKTKLMKEKKKNRGYVVQRQEHGTSHRADPRSVHVLEGWVLPGFRTPTSPSLSSTLRPTEHSRIKTIIR